MRDVIIKDWGWKLFSLLLAVAIWFTVHRILQESATNIAPISVTYEGLPVVIVSASADMREYHLLQPTVAVTLSGTPEAIGNLQAKQIHATVNLTDLTTVINAKQRVEVAAPPGVTVISVNPESIGVLAPPPKP